ncbi:MAG: tRNA (adenosine(37)-N6)-threonylcarbamoyltransferase complex dimerization subunit type 1 TsaB [Candidatus Buchananbacteria bacterium]
MYLIINTILPDQVVLYLANQVKLLKQESIKAKRSQTEKLLPAVANFLAKQKIAWSKVKAIGVVNGQGSFTSVRLGIMTANALGYAFNIPVIQILIKEELTPQLLKKFIQQTKKAKGFKLVLPLYNREPNITKPKERK